MTVLSRSTFGWKLRTRTLPLGLRTLLMGILNVTPDSFSDGARYPSVQAAVDAAARLLDQGADIIDIGGESTRPNAAPVAPAEEQARVLPVLRALLQARPAAIVSVDTYHASTARAAVETGAEIVNDVSGLLWDPGMADVLAASPTPPGLVLMHSRGAPRMWAELDPLPLDEVMPLVLSGLTHTLNLARRAGLRDAQIVLDPGFGFGKTGEENFVLLANLAAMRRFGLPVLAGLSRKRFLGPAGSAPDSPERLHATLAGNTAAVLAGAHILRVHDVTAARAAVDLADGMLATVSLSAQR